MGSCHFCYLLLLGSFLSCQVVILVLMKAVTEFAGFLHPQVMVSVDHTGVQNF